MLFDEFYFKQQINSATKEYKDKLKEIVYWKDVAGMFRKNKEKGVKEMVASFPHEGNKDNEEKVRAMAEHFGYEIVDELVKMQESVYSFRMR